MLLTFGLILLSICAYAQEASFLGVPMNGSAINFVKQLCEKYDGRGITIDDSRENLTSIGFYDDDNFYIVHEKYGIISSVVMMPLVSHSTFDSAYQAYLDLKKFTEDIKGMEFVYAKEVLSEEFCQCCYKFNGTFRKYFILKNDEGYNYFINIESIANLEKINEIELKLAN